MILLDRPNKMERTRASVAASVADLMSTPLLHDGRANEVLSSASMSMGGNMAGIEEAKAYLKAVSYRISTSI